MDILIKSRSGILLKTKDTVVYENINISLDPELFEHSTEIEDGFVRRTLTSYYNDRVTEIGDRAFKEWTTIIEVDFPNVMKVGNVAFYGCTQLKKINIPRVTSVGSQAFQGCSSVESMNLNQVPSLTDGCFRGCSKLKTFYSSKLNIIGSACFADCSQLTAFIIESDSVAKLNHTNAFVRTPIETGTGYIYVPADLIEEYKNATNWSTYTSQFKTIEELPQEIGEEIGLW